MPYCFRSQVLFEIQAILPETSPFLSIQMAVLSSFFQMFIVLVMYNFGPIVTGIRNNDDLQLNHDEISWMGASFSVGGLCGALSAGKTIFILQYFCFYFQLLSFKWKYSKEWSRRVFIFITLFSRSMLILCQHIIHCIHSTYLYMIL